jgi:hypothetical protein
VHAHDMHAYEVHACEVHAREAHAHEAHAYELHALETHARKVLEKTNNYTKIHPTKFFSKLVETTIKPKTRSQPRPRTLPAIISSRAPRTRFLDRRHSLERQ